VQQEPVLGLEPELVLGQEPVLELVRVRVRHNQ